MHDIVSKAKTLQRRKSYDEDGEIGTVLTEEDDFMTKQERREILQGKAMRKGKKEI